MSDQLCYLEQTKLNPFRFLSYTIEIIYGFNEKENNFRKVLRLIFFAISDMLCYLEQTQLNPFRFLSYTIESIYGFNEKENNLKKYLCLFFCNF